MTKRKFIRVTANFIAWKKPKQMLIPVDRITSVEEFLGEGGGKSEIHWGGGHFPVVTNVNEDITTIYKRLEGSEH